MGQRKTHRQFLMELKDIHPQIEALDEYTTALTKIRVRCCTCGNEWSVTPSSLLSHSGCPQCANRRKGETLRKTHDQFVKELRIKNSYIEVMSQYTGNRNKIHLKCTRCNHEWFSAPHDLLSGHGCPQCGLVTQRNAQRKSHEQFLIDLKQVNPNIDILNRYISNHTKATFICKECGHTWVTVPNSILSGHSCPECARTSSSFLEQTIYLAFKECLGEKSVKHRDRSAIGMELDIYIPELNVAYEPGSWSWHKRKKDRDILKRQRCAEKNIRLITVYTEYTEPAPVFDKDCITHKRSLGNTNWEETCSVVADLLSEHNLTLSECQWKKIKKDALERSRRQTHEQFEAKVATINPNISVVGKFIDTSTKITFECKVCGNLWETSPSVIMQNSGCPKCAHKRIDDEKRKTHSQFIDELQIKNPSIQVLGSYTGNKNKIACLCKVCNHEWYGRPNGLLRGQGCPVCARKRATDKQRKTHSQFQRELAEINPQVELLGEYIDAKTKLPIRCTRCEHIWYTAPKELLRGHGCPQCYGTHKRTQDEFVTDLSKSNDTIEVLGSYVNANEKISVRCRVCTHTWTPTPHDLLRGSRCPICSRRK